MTEPATIKIGEEVNYSAHSERPLTDVEIEEAKEVLRWIAKSRHHLIDEETWFVFVAPAKTTIGARAITPIFKPQTLRVDNEGKEPRGGRRYLYVGTEAGRRLYAEREGRDPRLVLLAHDGRMLTGFRGPFKIIRQARYEPSVKDLTSLYYVRRINAAGGFTTEEEIVG